MKANRLAITLFATMMFDALFWNELIGVNLLLFTLLLMGIGLYLNPKALKSTHTLLIAIGTLVSGAMVVYHNSGTAKIVHILSALIFMVMCQYLQFRSLAHAFGQLLSNLGNSLGTFWENLSLNWVKSKNLKKLSSILKLSFIPIFFLIIFFGIFRLANPKFMEATNQLWTNITNWFIGFSILRICLLLLGLVIAVISILPNSKSGFYDKDASAKDQLFRKRIKHGFRFSMVDLKKEYMTGLLLVALVNVMLFFNNVLDIQWLWFNFELPAGGSYKQLVHEGTYLLILSILLSMGIMLYFYRGNQNFYKKGKLLKYFTYTWILQNLILVISVGIRNYHYIANQGLAYKRIGVIFFLLLVVVGLLSLFMKIRDKMSSFYLLRVNSWAVYGLGIFLCLVSWDVFIAKYNFAHYHETGHLTLKLSAKTLPIMYSNMDLVSKHYEDNVYFYSTRFRRKERFYQEVWPKQSWKSWNYADAKAAKWLKEYKKSQP
ncbi:MAG: DUF4173 domain-containing protein [Bacteroidia bacterium]|nr:DUF4173 domain-containing protein [Bacteroidia bacterium]